MLANIGLYSYGASALAFSLLTARIAFSRNLYSSSFPLLAASAFTLVWASVIAYSTLQPYPLVKTMQYAEILRNAGWCFVLCQILAARLDEKQFLAGSRWTPWFVAVLVIAMALPWAASKFPVDTGSSITLSAWLCMAIAGLLLLEQVLRSDTQRERWSSKHLCLGLGLIFTYDFFMYAEALLFKQLDPALWQARGIVTALAAIFLNIAIGRLGRREVTRTINLSRHVVFHSVTLLAAGIYLVAMSLVGYFISNLGGTWGGVLQITFLCASGLLLLALLFSGQIRARTRVWLSKHFFSYKYDYRTEWLQFTQTLASGGDNIPANTIKAIAHLTRSSAGLLWSRSVDNRLDFAFNWEMPRPINDDGLEGLAQWLETTNWVIDIQEWLIEPGIYKNLEIPEFLVELPRVRLVIPLMFGDELQGILVLRESELQRDLNWEDRDLLKVAGRQAAAHLAQYQGNQALIESRQFEAFNRLSAYVIHDLKNILAQQSLIVSNAPKHKQNPEFVNDMIDTVENSVRRMTSLMEQMRSGVRGADPVAVELSELLHEVVQSRSTRDPKPQLTLSSGEVIVLSDKDRLKTVFGHLIQNAQEATEKDGQVDVRLREENNSALVEIEDNGRGMEEEFLRNSLFKPFESTKGLTGMGIGVFESREFIRNLGGEIQVESSPGGGSLFRVLLPCVQSDQTKRDNEKS